MRHEVVGLAWYEHEEDYARALVVMTDAAELPATYAAWRKKAQTVEATLKDQGYTVDRIRIEPDAFAGWCLVRGLEPAGEARSRFASEAVEKRDKETARRSLM